MYLSADQLKNLVRPSLSRSLANIAFDWVVIVSVAALTEHFFSWSLYILALLVIGNRQHGLLILMHDGSHSRLSAKKFWNDSVAEFLTAWPLFIRMKAYREKHLLHHRFSNTANDPDYRAERYLRFRRDIFKILLRDFLLLNTHEQLHEIKRLKISTSGTYKVLRLMFYVALAVALTYFGGWKVYLLYWILPAFTWLKVVLRIRAIADHTGLQNRLPPFDTRNIIPTQLDRIFFAPHNCSYHLVHHIYGYIPCFRLKEAFALMMESPEFRKGAHITQGFHGFFREFPWDRQKMEAGLIGEGINLVDNMPSV